ncbi:O-antigen polymerase [Aliarcobacter cryaerophilus]|uniref:O-antigen polymerase n=1 Tax=Aliarcobacter cryaerophilus TaxID=28198 RepID=UPI003DA56E90
MYKVSFTSKDITYEIHTISNAMIFIFYSMFFLGYFLKKRVVFQIKDRMKVKAIKNHLIVLTFISAICFFIYLYTYGGLEYILSNISQIRTGTSEYRNYLAIFIRLFSDYIFIVFLSLFFYKISTKKELFYLSDRTVKLLYVLFYITLIIILTKKFMDGGRGGMISVFIFMIIIYSLKYKTIRLKYITLVIVVALILVFFGKTILFELFTDRDLPSIEFSYIEYLNRFLLEFAYPYISLVNVIYLNLSAERIFMDFYGWMFTLLKIFGINDLDAVSYYNTYHLIGIWRSVIPPGIVAFLLLEGGILMIPLGAFILGIMFYHLDILIYKISFSNNPILLALATIMIVQFTRLLNSADISLFIQSSFIFIILTLYLLIFKYITFYKVKRGTH